MANKESHLRSILKAITWRVIATSTTFGLALFVFRDTPDALEKSTIVAGLELVIKLVIYYVHERAWQATPFGAVTQVIAKSSANE